MEKVKIKILSHTIYDLEVIEPGSILEVSKAFGLGLVYTKQAELLKEEKENKEIGEEVILKENNKDNKEENEIETKKVTVTKRKNK